MKRISKTQATRLLALTLLTGAGGSARALPPDDVVEEAIDCYSELQGITFAASPTSVRPFASTTLSWNVPAGCSGQIQVAGRNVNRQGSLQVTPQHATTKYLLVARSVGGARTTLATVSVSVNQSTCTTIAVPGSVIAPLITEAIDEIDAGDDDFYQIAAPEIEITPSHLGLTLFLGVDSSYFDPTVTLEMHLVFSVNAGTVHAAYTYFHPVADTTLPDDWVTSEFYDRADGILADFDSNINEQLPLFVPEGQRLFDLRTDNDAFLATVCTAPRVNVGLATELDVRTTSASIAATARAASATTLP